MGNTPNKNVNVTPNPTPIQIDCTGKSRVSMPTLAAIRRNGVADISRTIEEPKVAGEKKSIRFTLMLGNGDSVKLRKTQFERLLRPVAIDPNSDKRVVAVLTNRVGTLVDTHIKEQRKMTAAISGALAPVLEKLDRLIAARA